MAPLGNDWLHGYQSRRNIKQNTRHGEAGSLSEKANFQMMCQALKAFQPQDIYNCDETSLYWKLMPDRSLSTQSVPGLEKIKARISLLFCCNSDASDKVPLWIIGTAEQPKAFTASGINIENLGCVWQSNKYAWVTEEVFKKWLLWFDSRMAGRKVALLMNSFSAREAAVREIRPNLQNTLVMWLPCNSTARYQPLDQGVIYTWKAYWRRQWILFMMFEYDKGYNPLSTMTVLLAVRWAISAWYLDLKKSTIQNCFQKALTSRDIREDDCQAIIAEISQRIQQLQTSNNIQNAMDINQFLNPEEEQIDYRLKILDDIILSRYSSTDAVGEEEEVHEPLPYITTQEALESLYRLRLHEEQQNNGHRPLIQQLLQHEWTLLARREVNNQRQSDIRSFFGTGT